MSSNRIRVPLARGDRLAQRRPGGPGRRACSRAKRLRATGDRRHDRDLGVLLDLRVEALEVTDVLVVDVDVDEAADLPRRRAAPRSTGFWATRS
jgi:hypothetical protein